MEKRSGLGVLLPDEDEEPASGSSLKDLGVLDLVA